jgi:hypothetical protein
MSWNIDSRVCTTGCGSSLVLENVPFCDKKAWRGRISEIYLVPCEYSFTETNVTDLVWWETIVNAGKLIAIQGIGSTDQDSSLKVDAGSCDGEEIADITWKLDFEVKKFDLEEFEDFENANKIMQGAYRNYNLVARYCRPNKDTLLPIGRFSLKELADVHPGGVNDFHTLTYTFTWTPSVLSVPTPLKVAGISAVLPQF